MTLTSTSLTDGQPINPEYAFCQPDGDGRATNGGNRSPQLAWSGAPEGTKSFAILLYDPDVPADASKANKPLRTIDRDAERTVFYHWLLVDIPADTEGIIEGEASDGVTEGGKAPGRSALGLAGTNTFTDFLAGSPREGTYGGYDGPCPPWNDERTHHYHVLVHALDVESLGLSEDGDFRGDDVREAMKGHVLAHAEIVGTYTTNPKLA